MMPDGSGPCARGDTRCVNTVTDRTDQHYVAPTHLIRLAAVPMQRHCERVTAQLGRHRAPRPVGRALAIDERDLHVQLAVERQRHARIGRCTAQISERFRFAANETSANNFSYKCYYN